MAVVLFLFILLQLQCFQGFLIYDGSITVQTPVGDIIGTLHNIHFDGQHYQVKEFLGIPYAEPLIGDKRFRKPVPKAAFTKPFNASDFGPKCLQGPSPVVPAGQDFPMSVDCLYLNIFAPVTSGSCPKNFP